MVFKALEFHAITLGEELKWRRGERSQPNPGVLQHLLAGWVTRLIGGLE